MRQVGDLFQFWNHHPPACDSLARLAGALTKPVEADHPTPDPSPGPSPTPTDTPTEQLPPEEQDKRLQALLRDLAAAGIPISRKSKPPAEQ